MACRIWDLLGLGLGLGLDNIVYKLLDLLNKLNSSTLFHIPISIQILLPLLLIQHYNLNRLKTTFKIYFEILSLHFPLIFSQKFTVSYRIAKRTIDKEIYIVVNPLTHKSTVPWTKWWKNQRRSRRKILKTAQYTECMIWEDGRYYNLFNNLCLCFKIAFFRRQRSVLCAISNSPGERNGKGAGMKSQLAVTDANRRGRKETLWI